MNDTDARTTVLIVDDDKNTREGLERALKCGYRVLLAESGERAMDLLRTEAVDIMLTDLRMPGVDGFQICRTIKADPESSRTVVIAMTGYHSAETESRILECGAVHCFSKPIEPSKVLTAMGRTPEQARGSLRFSVGWGIDAAQIDRVVALLCELVPRVRNVEAP